MLHAAHLRARAARSDRRRGVSLLGVLLVLCGIAVAAMVAIPMYFAQHEVTLDAACRLFARDLRGVQNRAGFSHAPGRLVVHANGWHGVDDADREITDLGESHPIRRRLSANGVFEGVEVREIALGDDDCLSVDTRGMIAERGWIVLYFGTDWRRIDVERGAGRVHVTSSQSGESYEARVDD
jgi:hypothetical protein